MSILYPDPLAIKPFSRPVSGAVEVPGSKSITNRMLMLACMASNTVELTGALLSDDSQYMVECLQKLGFQVKIDPAKKSIHVSGTKGEIPSEKASLFVGVAGTAARFLTAFCATRNGGQFVIDGTPQMQKRPMKGLLDALEQQGTDIHSNDGFLPATLSPHGLKGGRIQLETSASTQLLSALLMVAPLAEEDLEIKISGGAEIKPFVRLTQELMYRFGQPKQHIQSLGDGKALLRVKAGIPYSIPEIVAIEPDASAASYFLSLPLVVGGSVTVKGLHSNSLQGDYAYTEVLREIGMNVEETEVGTTASIQLKELPGAGINRNFWPISDTFLTLAAISPLLKGITRIEGIAHTRHQESDRVAAMANELIKLGQWIEEGDDYIEIHAGPMIPSEVMTYHDHRVAMSFGILGCFNLYGDGTPWLKISNPGCCSKTFPEFFIELEKLRTA
ncbi:MAG: 3-phosphoshikimate 1-carboxyvinyltransferase [Verrucomicrobia bacterium]|nr:3-phosphoshikimate 1-carboxyvinyltransferase [Verrucomicrobiota bacterium]MDA1065197.1 3-phosphoshikimate 1-carboxyvinyltransferase [Verrucomicrobiota bacterium]